MFSTWCNFLTIIPHIFHNHSSLFFILTSTWRVKNELRSQLFFLNMSYLASLGKRQIALSDFISAANQVCFEKDASSVTVFQDGKSGLVPVPRWLCHVCREFSHRVAKEQKNTVLELCFHSFHSWLNFQSLSNI